MSWTIKLARFLHRIQILAVGVWRDAPTMGVSTALHLHSVPLLNRIRELFGLSQSWPVVNVKLTGIAHPFGLRTGTSDYDAYRQIFVDQEYRRTTEAQNVKTIVDCGANAGYASIYFLNCFPEAELISVEPAPENAELCRSNLAPYSDRATLVEAGIWDHVGDLVLVPSAFGDGNKWGISVRAQRSGEQVKEPSGVVQAVDIPKLIQLSRRSAIDILKVDIERSEAIVFNETSTSWLPRVRNIVIELHDANCEAVFRGALAEYSYREFNEGDLTYCFGLSFRSGGGLIPKDGSSERQANR